MMMVMTLDARLKMIATRSKTTYMTVDDVRKRETRVRGRGTSSQQMQLL